MHINVTDILAQDEGYRKSFEIVDETIELEDLALAENLNGTLTVGRTEAGLAVDGNFRTAVMLECHRCLREFAFPEELKLRGDYSFKPDEDQWPIAKDNTIDLAGLVEQEIVVGIPIKQLCQPDCPGLDAETGQPINQ